MMNSDSIGLIKKQFTWRTEKGEILTLPQMKTSHIFNCFKMAFNHVAVHYKGTPIRFTKQWPDYHKKAKKNPKQLAWLTWVFHTVLETRKDMSLSDRLAYNQIMDQIYSNPNFKDDLKKLPKPQRKISKNSLEELVKPFDTTVGMSNGNDITEHQLDLVELDIY